MHAKSKTIFFRIEIPFAFRYGSLSKAVTRRLFPGSSGRSRGKIDNRLCLGEKINKKEEKKTNNFNSSVNKRV